jgi:hypothetical protein
VSAAVPTAAQTTALPSETAPFLSVEAFPGPLCLAHLERHHLAVALDASSAYLTPAAESLYGRAQVAGLLVPSKACAAELIAYWIWRGGTLPHEIAVVSTSHFRAERYGRHITVLNRAIDPRQKRRLNGVYVTSPERTAVDVACLPRTVFDNAIGLGNLALFLEYYEIPVETCRHILKANPRWPGFSNAMTVFRDLETERRKFE